jgi:hypothetical protein
LRPAEALKGGKGRNETGRNLLISQEVAASCDRLIPCDPRAGDGARTHDGNLESPGTNAKGKSDLWQGTAALTPYLHTDPDLARVAAAWATLPAHIKAALLALVTSAGS